MTPTRTLTSKLFDQVRLNSKVIVPYGSWPASHLRIYFNSRVESGRIRVKIFNLRNQLVKELQVEQSAEGYFAEWDCRDHRERTTQGIFVYQIEIDGQAQNGAFVVAK